MCARFDECTGPQHREKEKAGLLSCFLGVGDPYGNRTHVSALRGPCLSLLTNGPWFIAILLYYIFRGLSIVFLIFFKKIFFLIFCMHFMLFGKDIDV